MTTASTTYRLGKTWPSAWRTPTTRWSFRFWVAPSQSAITSRVPTCALKADFATRASSRRKPPHHGGQLEGRCWGDAAEDVGVGPTRPLNSSAPLRPWCWDRRTCCRAFHPKSTGCHPAELTLDSWSNAAFPARIRRCTALRSFTACHAPASRAKPICGQQQGKQSSRRASPSRSPQGVPPSCRRGMATNRRSCYRTGLTGRSRRKPSGFDLRIAQARDSRLVAWN